MSDVPEAAPATPPTASRSHLVTARVLTVLAVILTVVSVLANFVKREALDSSHFRTTSESFIADATIRDRLADRLVNELYENVNITAAIEQRLPENLKPLAGVIAGSTRNATHDAARRLLDESRVQRAFVDASVAAQRHLIAVLDDESQYLQTRGNSVILDLRPLVVQLGDRFSFVPDLDSRLPEGAGQITILESDRLGAAQEATRDLRLVANWIWLLALAAAVGAVWLARDRRRLEVRALAIGLVVAGFLILIVRTLAGRELVDELAASESGRPATAATVDLLTDPLRGAGWTGILIGVVALAGIWLSGPGARAVSSRRVLAPYMRRPGIVHGTLLVLYLLLLWWRPTPQFGSARTIIVWLVLAVVGVEVLRRQTVREFPDAEPTDLTATVRGWFARRHRDSSSVAGSVDDLERIAQLHSGGQLDDEEFSSFKARLLGTGSPDAVATARDRPSDTPPATPPSAGSDN